MTTGNIVSEFRATEICPYNKDVIPIQALAPIFLTERARPNDNSSDYDSDDCLPQIVSQLQTADKTANNNSFPVILPTPKLAKKRTAEKESYKLQSCRGQQDYLFY
ncbi:hypothetical protein QE152_g5611 [Popillia japonica]|uniref:Uncharacterized protein n=1 Tax=Popillia japonica TaxID=7064 RepID=A0AAW1MK05_POPJA